MAKTKLDLNNLSGYRKQLGLNQQAFWGPLGVTQSAGSRYESDRGLPKPTALLLTLRESGKISNQDIAAAMTLVTRAKQAKKSK